MNAIAPDEAPSPEDHAYVLAIEHSFLVLRRKAALLTAADWQEAQGWHRKGIPVELVQNVMERLFERQRGRRGRTITGLRYFRAAVETAWEEMLALKAGGRAEESLPLSVRARLENLASWLPVELPESARWVAAIAVLGGVGGVGRGEGVVAPAEEVEAALRQLDAELLKTLRAGLGAEESRRIAGEVEQALARLRGRVAEVELAVAAGRLEEQLLRRHFAVPVLSLFAAEARSEGGAPDSGG